MNRWVRDCHVALALLILFFLSGCLESEEAPKLNRNDVVILESLTGWFSLFETSDTNQGKVLHRFTPKADGHYAVMQIEYDMSTKTVGSKSDMGDVAFLRLQVVGAEGQTFLAVMVNAKSGLERTKYYELQQTPRGFTWAWYEVKKDQSLVTAAAARAKVHGVILDGDKLAGRITGQTLQALFSDSIFRKALTITHEPVSPLAAEDQYALRAAAGESDTLTGLAQESVRGAGLSSTQRDLGELIQKLQARVTVDGPFNQSLLDRLVAVLEDSGRSASTQEMLAKARDFAEGSIRPSMFAAYLNNALLMTSHDQSGLTGSAWLQRKSEEGDLWAKYYLSRAHLHAARDDRQARLVDKLEWTGLGEDIRPYWEASQVALRDEKFQAHLGTMVRLVEEGIEKDFSPLRHLKGVMLVLGLGVKQDKAEGIRLIMRAADAGFIVSMDTLANLYLNGDGIEKNEAEGAKWMQKAAALGRASSMNDLGALYLNGQGVTKNEAEAVKWIQRAANLSFPAAMANLGRLYSRGIGVSKNETEAVRWYRQAAESGDADAMLNLGIAYASGRGVTKDEDAAVKWYEQSAGLGSSQAMYRLGLAYERGLGVRKDSNAAVQWYQKGAERGDTPAMTNLGNLYFYGQGIPEDKAKAAQWYRKAAEAGDARAMEVLGGAYVGGSGVAKDVISGVGWLQKAAERGQPGAMFSLGIIYSNGEGVGQDYGKSLSWYRKAAEGGHAVAMNNLAVMLRSGQGTSKNEEEAARWFQKAAMLGSKTAMFNLGSSYESGVGVSRALDKALEWYQKAAAAGYKDAEQAVLRVQAALATPAPGPGQVRSNPQTVPPAAPSPPTAAARAWGEAYRSARVISPAEFLNLMTSARLEFTPSPGLLEYHSASALEERARKAIEREGIRISNDAAITIKVRWEFQQHTIIKTTETSGSFGYTTDREKHTVLLYACRVEFELVTPLYRNGSFYNRKVMPAGAFSQGRIVAGNDYIQRGIKVDVVDGLVEGIGDALGIIRNNTEKPQFVDRMLWNPNADEPFFRAYANARREKGESLDRVFTEVDGVSKITVKLENDAGMFLDETNVHNRWANSLPDAKLGFLVNGTGQVRQWLHLNKTNASILQSLFGDVFYIPFGVMVSSSSIIENTIIELNGGYYRSSVVLLRDFRLSGDTWDKMEAVFPNFAYGSMGDVLKESRFRR